ncbi:MAG: hypothetical protein WAW96_07845 [Alphaproteobacteria bacterium]
MTRAFRILPVLLVAMLVMTGLQALKLWTGFVAIGAAQAQDGDAAKKLSTPAPPASAPPAPAAADASTSSAAPSAQAAGVTGSTGADATAPTPAPVAEEKDANIPALAPQDNPPPAPAAVASTQPAPQPVVKQERPKIPGEADFMSASEIEVLTSLTKRREELDKRQAELDMREKLLMATEQRLDQKLAEIKSIQSVIQSAVGTLNDKQQKEIASLVKVYENMKPKDAAAIMQDLDRTILLEVASRMKEAKMAPILAAMEPSKAREITVLLAKRNEIPGQSG